MQIQTSRYSWVKRVLLSPSYTENRPTLQDKCQKQTLHNRKQTVQNFWSLKTNKTGLHAINISYRPENVPGKKTKQENITMKQWFSYGEEHWWTGYLTFIHLHVKSLDLSISTYLLYTCIEDVGLNKRTNFHSLKSQLANGHTITY